MATKKKASPAKGKRAVKAKQAGSKSKAKSTVQRPAAKTKKPVIKGKATGVKKAVPKKNAPKKAVKAEVKTASQKGSPSKKAKPKAKPATKAGSTTQSKAKKTVKKPEVKSLPVPQRPAPFSFGRMSKTPVLRKKSKPEKKLTAAELKTFRQMLLNLRDSVVDGISFLSGDNLNRSQRDASGDLSGYSLHMADQGTDNYDREFALNLVSSEQDVLYEIDEAIRRIDAGTYGVCEMSGEPIERARLKVVPYARYSVTAQSEMERGRTRYRPFGPTLSHGG